MYKLIGFLFCVAMTLAVAYALAFVWVLAASRNPAVIEEQEVIEYLPEPPQKPTPAPPQILVPQTDPAPVPDGIDVQVDVFVEPDPIKLYLVTAGWCPACLNVERALDEAKMPYTRVDYDGDRAAAKAMMDGNYVPQLWAYRQVCGTWYRLPIAIPSEAAGVVAAARTAMSTLKEFRCE
jgi:glutaredoxin